MKLLYAPPSPYARRCRILAREIGLSDRVEEVFAMPYDNPDALLAANPLVKIPALVEDDGTRWYDSAVICRRMLDLVGRHDDWPDLKGMQLEVLVTGITDAAFWIVNEKRRSDTDKPSAMWLKRWETAISRGMEQLEIEAGRLDGELANIPAIGAAATLGYLDFRHPQIDWRASCPRLSGWFERMAARPSLIETAPDLAA